MSVTRVIQNNNTRNANRSTELEICATGIYICYNLLGIFLISIKENLYVLTAVWCPLISRCVKAL